MILYLLIFALSIFFLFVDNKKIKVYGPNVLLCLMALMYILRAEDVGVDTQSYIRYFSEEGIERYLEKDPLYGLITLTIYKYTNDFYYVQLVMGILTFVPLIYVVNKKSENLALSLFIILFSTNRYFLDSFNTARQCASTSFLLLCWVSLEDKKKLMALIWFLIAWGLHHSALFYAPIALLAYRFRLSNSIIVSASIGTFLFSILFSDMKMLVNMEEYLFSSEFIDKYDTYHAELARTIWALLPVILPYTVIVVLYYKKFQDSILFRLFAYGTIFANFISVLPMAYRISFGIIALEIFVYPLLLKYKNNRFVIIGTLVCLFIFSVWTFLMDCEKAQLVPYKTIFGWTI